MAHSRSIRARFIKLDKRLDKYPLITTILVLLLCGAIILLRKQSALSNPQFWAEDGVVWFQQAYNQGFWHTILVPYSGTLSFATRLVASTAVRFPIQYSPLIFNLASLFAQLIPIFLINSSRLRGIIRYRSLAILISLMFVCVTNSTEVFVNLTNIQWHLGVAAFLILISARPKILAWKIFDYATLILVGLTGPLTLALLPVAFIIWLRGRNRDSLRNFLLVIATAIAQFVSLFILEPGQRGGAAASPLSAIQMLVGQVYTSSIMGDRYIYTFYNGLFPYFALPVALFIVIYAIRKGPSWIGYAQLFALTLFILMLGSLKAVGTTNVWSVLTQPGAGQRYWYIPILVWLSTLVWIALAAKSVIMRLICGVFLVLFVFVGVPDSWSIPALPNLNYKVYAKQFDKLPKGQTMTIPGNPPAWSYTLKKR